MWWLVVGAALLAAGMLWVWFRDRRRSGHGPGEQHAAEAREHLLTIDTRPNLRKGQGPQP